MTQLNRFTMNLIAESSFAYWIQTRSLELQCSICFHSPYHNSTSILLGGYISMRAQENIYLTAIYISNISMQFKVNVTSAFCSFKSSKHSSISHFHGFLFIQLGHSESNNGLFASAYSYYIIEINQKQCKHTHTHKRNFEYQINAQIKYFSFENGPTKTVTV